MGSQTLTLHNYRTFPATIHSKNNQHSKHFQRVFTLEAGYSDSMATPVVLARFALGGYSLQHKSKTDKERKIAMLYASNPGGRNDTTSETKLI